MTRQKDADATRDFAQAIQSHKRAAAFNAGGTGDATRRNEFSRPYSQAEPSESACERTWVAPGA
ncbi:hypothetical protein [Caballeronia sp. LZ001]|uniref:hypothetical protein n=1 Tax=Caballeronia sp. LZ001 TaxID=3038553 RepID=UPI00285CBBCF|nr:hypothetical protein [Caballeronia sp. LZ001]MDR5806392.1 hypothetical protein [Caballeronia sp. LZ001]